MNERIAQLRDITIRDHHEMRAIFEQLTDETMLRKADDNWTVGQLAHHIATSPRGQIIFVNRLRRGRNLTIPKPLRFVVNIRNWWMTRNHKQPDRDDLLATLDDSHRALLATIDTLTDEELDRGGVILDQGHMTLYENLKQGGDHARDHARQLQVAAGA